MEMWQKIASDMADKLIYFYFYSKFTINSDEFIGRINFIKCILDYIQAIKIIK
jgi:hypothetical protein